MQPVHPDQSNWREWLLASLQGTGAQPSERQTFFGVVLPILGMFAIVIAGYFVGTIASQSKSGAVFLLIVLWLVFAAIVFSIVHNSVLRWTWQTRARSTEKELRRIDSRRPIVYLRSTIPCRSSEQRLIHGLGGLGPVIAIGRPGEQLPAFGAARLSISREEWQQKLADVASVSQFVVWATGVNEDLSWEISPLAESMPLERLILWAHPQVVAISPGDREVEWSRFRNTLGPLFPHPLPERLGETRFIYFTSSHEPIPVEPRGWGNAQDTAHVQLLRANGLPAMDWGDFLLSFRGRINRAKYWMGALCTFLLLFFWTLIVSGVGRSSRTGSHATFYFVAVLSLVALLVPTTAIGVKRLHDRAKSGRWLLLLYLTPALLLIFGLREGSGAGQTLITIIALAFIVWMLIELGCLAGTDASNIYGPDPRATRIMSGFTVRRRR